MMGVGAKRAIGLYRSCAPRQPVAAAGSTNAEPAFVSSFALAHASQALHSPPIPDVGQHVETRKRKASRAPNRREDEEVVILILQEQEHHALSLLHL